ncbi:MAG TPA: flagellar hook-basal body complex protein [Chloroflexota bacterium]|nr:flagellar hook-basal body complex protein [Chloroflexota bacterium]
MNSLYGTPVTGMQGAEFQLDVVADNIANLNTDGFQAVEPVLSSLPFQAEIGDPNNGVVAPAATHIGMGVQPMATMRSQRQAPLVPTYNPLDLATKDQGFFALRRPDGQTVYSSEISLQLQPNGQVTTTEGLSLAPPVRVPNGVTHITADTQGRIIGHSRNGTTVVVGRTVVVGFAAPENLRALGNNTYAESLSSGRPQIRGVDQTQIVSGFRRASTVDLATELTAMVDAQHMYEANARALQTLDAFINNAVSLPQR